MDSDVLNKTRKRRNSGTCRLFSTDPSHAEEVLIEDVHGVKIFTLNRPASHNALNLNMIRIMYPKLKQLDVDERTRLVIVTGSGSKAFCSGGDLIALFKAAATTPKAMDEYVAEEYRLDYLTGTLKVPYLALLNGITMGGGVGLSVHGHYRVATEKTVFAMPETKIGFYPDVGGSYFLPRLRGFLGFYLGLTGARLTGRDVFHAGIATHFVHSSSLTELTNDLCVADSRIVSDVLDEFHAKSADEKHQFSLAPFMNKIDFVFSAPTVAEILHRLRKDGSEWSLNCLENLSKMSPTSLVVTLKALQRGRALSFEECFRMEYRLSRVMLKAPDFKEGVRALLVHKDQNPQWKPSTVEAVNELTVDSYFQVLGEDEELNLY